MEASAWTIVTAVTLGNSPINQLRSGCHRLDIGQSGGSVGLEVGQTGGGGSMSETGLYTVGTLGLVMGKPLLGKEEGTVASGPVCAQIKGV